MPVSERSPIDEAVAALAEVTDRSLAVRYAELWLNQAKSAPDSETEIRYLVCAERSIGGALLASAAPTPAIQRAFNLTVEARREATD